MLSSIGVARIIATVSAAGCLDLATLGGLTWGWGRIWPWMMDDWNTKVTKDDQMNGLFDKLWQSTGSKQFHIEVSLIPGSWSHDRCSTSRAVEDGKVSNTRPNDVGSLEPIEVTILARPSSLGRSQAFKLSSLIVLISILLNPRLQV